MMETPDKNYNSFYLAIIIPFFNEGKRMDLEPFIRFTKENNDVLLLLVDDGSADNTGQLLEKIHRTSPDSTQIITLTKNTGKGNAIRKGMEKAITYQIPYTAFLDADLSASFEEILKLYNHIKASDYFAVFGSRLKKPGANIQRSQFRHIAGRIIAAIIEFRFKIGIHDTQCSAKIFTTSLLPSLIQQAFFTKWFFDVEIMLRARNNNSLLKMLEIPLDNWEHKAGSKINVCSFLAVIKEIKRLFTKY